MRIYRGNFEIVRNGSAVTFYEKSSYLLEQLKAAPLEDGHFLIDAMLEVNDGVVTYVGDHYTVSFEHGGLQIGGYSAKLVDNQALGLYKEKYWIAPTRISRKKIWKGLKRIEVNAIDAGYYCKKDNVKVGGVCSNFRIETKGGVLDKKVIL